MTDSKVGVLLVALTCFLPAPGALGDLVSHWSFDGVVEDSGPAGNDAEFRGDVDPTFVEGYDGTSPGAILFDGVDDFIEITTQNSLPVYYNPAYSVTLWVNGGPQPDYRVYSESSTTNRTPLFNIGTQNGGTSGQVDIFIRTETGQLSVAHRLSTGIAFDFTWHHIAWVDDNGQAVLYIDGVPDATDFTYTKPDMPFDKSTIGGILRNTPSHWFNGMIDDVRLYDHALTQFEVSCLTLEGCPACPDVGDTHCGAVSVSPPGGLVGTYTVTATGAIDNSGNPILYLFEAVSDAGAVVQAGPQLENTAALVLGRGTWTVSVTVDDDPGCADVAADAKCTAAPVVVTCPVAGDTHCSSVQVTPGPADGSPGIYTVTAVGAIDDSGGAISYYFRAENTTGLVLTAGPQPADTVDFFLGAGTWTISVTVDDDADCADQAASATCTTQVEVTCPAGGDTHCDGLVVTGPPESTPGTYTAVVQSATDDSGDAVLYTFRAETPEGKVVQVGPQEEDTALLVLSKGVWTVHASVDDNTACFDAAPDAVCNTEIVVEDDPPGMISHWKFDGDTSDSQSNANHGVFQGGPDVDPTFVAGFDGSPGGAIRLDGIDDCVAVTENRNLPLYTHEAFTIALWVNGGPQPDFRVWSEGWSFSNVPLFTMGTASSGATGQVDLFVRSGANQVLVGHLLSQRNAFDGTWHHIAYVDDGGKAAIYIDGVREATNLNYAKPLLPLDRTSIGCVLRAAASHYFSGAIDDVRVYNYALSQSEIEALVPPPSGCPAAGDTHCGNLAVVGAPGGGEGVYTATLTGATDDSASPVIYTFTAEDGDGNYIQVGPQAGNTASFNLFAGGWTIRATADDDLACRDKAGDAVCTRTVTVSGPPKVFLSQWKFDGDMNDAGPAMNHGAFVGAGAPTFTTDRVGTASAALKLDGADDYVLVSRQAGLPLYSNREFSVAMWVSGPPQPDRRVWSESASASNNPMFNIGTQNAGATGQVDIFIRDAIGAVVLGHALSAGIAFDGTWHHIAWVDRAGMAVLYIDGVRDAASFNYPKPMMPFNVTTIGGILRATPCCFFNGALDDVRAYSYALTDVEVRELAGLNPPPPKFRRGDCNDDGGVDISDAVCTLDWLFLGGLAPGCTAATNPNGDKVADISDAVYLLAYLFLGGPAPVSPSPDCGPGTLAADEELGCVTPPRSCQ